jgi:hypothetical protein
MSGQDKIITREELYEAVWSKTLKTLAQEWNTTYLRLAQACQEMEIPRPSQGHWQAIALGHTIEKPPLPARTEITPQQLVLLPQGVRQVKTPTPKENPTVADAVRKLPEIPNTPRQQVNLSQAAEEAILDLMRQAKKIDFWRDKLLHRMRPYELTGWLGLEEGIKFAESRLLGAIKNVRKEFKSFQVKVEETQNQYRQSEPEIWIEIDLRDGFEWKDAWEEAWSFAEKPNSFCLSDNALRLHAWSKGPKNTGALVKWNKIGAQAGLRKTYSDLEDHLWEIRLKADSSIQWEIIGDWGHKQVRVWFENKDLIYYQHGPLNPTLGLNVAEVRHAELERFQKWLFGEISKPGFPEGNEVVGILDIRDRKTVKRVFKALPKEVGSYGSMPGFFNALRLPEGMEIRHSFEDGAGPWLVVCQPDEGFTWREIKARLAEKANEIPLEKKYNLSADSLALLRWILDLRKDEFLQQMTPPVEERMENEIGFQADLTDENFRAYLELLLEEINEKTEFNLRAINWKSYSDILTRIHVKAKGENLDEVVRAVQVWGLRQNKLLANDKVKAAIKRLLE